MVVADEREQPTQRLLRTAHLFAKYRMRTHDFPLFPVQFARLEKYGIGDAYLAYVVYVASHIKRQEAATVQPHRHPQRYTRRRQTCAMSRRMTVPLFHHPGNRGQDVFGLAEPQGTH